MRVLDRASRLGVRLNITRVAPNTLTCVVHKRCVVLQVDLGLKLTSYIIARLEFEFEGGYCGL